MSNGDQQESIFTLHNNEAVVNKSAHLPHLADFLRHRVPLFPYPSVVDRFFLNTYHKFLDRLFWLRKKIRKHH